VLQIGQHTPKQVIKYTHRKLNTQTKQCVAEHREKIAINRNYNVQILNKTTAKITLNNMSKQGMYNN